MILLDVQLALRDVQTLAARGAFVAAGIDTPLNM
jgi:hypothetical protein